MCGRVDVLCARLRASWEQAKRARSTLLEGEINPHTLVFKVVDVEKGFVEKRRAQLETSVCVVALFVLVFGSLELFAFEKYWEILLDSARDQLEAIKRVRAALQCSLLGGFFAALCALFVLSRRGAISVYSLELGAVCSMAMWQALRWAPKKYYVARLSGVADPSVLWSARLEGEDTNILIWNCVGLTVVHAMLPIRWKLTVPFGVVSLLGYVLPAFLLGSPSVSFGPNNATPLVGIICMLCIAKRFEEVKDRELHFALLREKRLRCQAEFALEGAGSLALAQPPRHGGPAFSVASDDLASTARAAPSTTATAALFRGVHEDGAISLEALADLGRKEQWLIEADEITLSERRQLGHGGFGVVNEGVYQGVAVAVKSPRADVYGAVRGVTMRELCNELCILRRLRHPSIVFLYGAVLKLEGAFELMLVLELIHGSTLRDYLCPASAASDRTRLQLMLHVSSAVKFLHTRQPTVVHGDLKAENIFVEVRSDSPPLAKLLDFGLSRLITRRARPSGGTLRWMAPEVMTGERAPNPAADVFSFGRVVYFAVTGLLPFHTVRKERLEQTLRQSPELGWPCASPEDGLAWCCKAIVEHCTRAEPAARPSMQEVHSNLSTAMDLVRVAGGRAASAPAAAGAVGAPAVRGRGAMLAPVPEAGPAALPLEAQGAAAGWSVPTRACAGAPSSSSSSAGGDQEEQAGVPEESGTLTYQDFQEAMSDIGARTRRQCSEACLGLAQDIITSGSTLGKQNSESLEELTSILSNMIELLQTMGIDPYLPVDTGDEETPDESRVQECSSLLPGMPTSSLIGKRCQVRV